MTAQEARILIVDDEKDVCDILFRMLKKHGFRPIVANDGEKALEMIRMGMPEIVLLDVMMPGMDGPTTFLELRKNHATAGIPVLLLTAKVQGTDQRRFADLGVEAVLFKPFDPLTLSTQIAAALGWS